MRLVYEGYEILREIVQKAERSLARFSSVEITAVVFDARTVTQLLYHLEIVLDTLLYTLGLERFAHFLEVVYLLI